MFSKIIFVLATLCVVNASVITVNVYDDNPETEVAANPKSCNWQACDQLCRRLKFPSGTCVNGRCKCDNFLNAEDGVAEKSLTDLEDLVSLTDDYSEIELAANPKKCNWQACDQLCRRLKFPGGTCVNGRCKCDNFLNAEVGVSEESVYDLEDSVLEKDDPETEFAAKPSKCHLKLCNLLCHLLNNTSGACVDGHCKCANKTKTQVSEESLSDPEESVSPRGCNSQGCIELCRKLKLHGGTCFRGRCVCKLSLLEDAVPETFSDVQESDSLRKCTHQACNDLCRRLKFREGVCIAGRCSCNNYFPNPQDAMTDLMESLLNTEDEVLDNSLPVSELSEDQIERSCNMRACEQLCRRLKFPGGACVNGRCKCDNFFRTEDADAVDEYSELALRRVCRIKKCNRTCTRRGYEGARCVDGLCECFNKRQTDPSFLNEVIIDEQEDSNLVVRTNEEELMVPSTRACITVNCNKLCHRLNYAGGMCRGGVCRCY